MCVPRALLHQGRTGGQTNQTLLGFDPFGLRPTPTIRLPVGRERSC